MNIQELAEQADIKSPDLWKLTIGPTAIFQLEKFAELVAAHEREECAKVCEAHKLDNTLVHNNAVVGCAAAIRARGQA
jgi:hypothetical protein